MKDMPIVECIICGAHRPTDTAINRRCRDCGKVFFACCGAKNLFPCEDGRTSHRIIPIQPRPRQTAQVQAGQPLAA